jgi:hypothetical protein
VLDAMTVRGLIGDDAHVAALSARKVEILTGWTGVKSTVPALQATECILSCTGATNA